MMRFVIDNNVRNRFPPRNAALTKHSLFDTNRVATLDREDNGASPIEEQTMKLKNQSRPRLPVEDYSHAIRNAVSWLGDRYLLAAPIDSRSIFHLCGLPPRNRVIDPQLRPKGEYERE
jgi:hypothetical protein